MKVFIVCFGAAFLLCVVIACSRDGNASKDIVVGGLYASKGDDGVYRISKVLAVDRVAHVRLYKNKFKSLPQDIDPATLSLGGLGDPDGFGMSHVPIAKEGFWSESPTLLKKLPVTAEELEGYKYYLAQMKK